MLRGFCEAEVALAALERQSSSTRETISVIHETTPYPRFIDRLPDDVLSHIFCLVAADVAPEDVPVGNEYYDLVEDGEEGVPQPLSRPQPRFPEQIILVNRRWRNVGLGTAVIWTRIISDPKHPPERIARWLARSEEAPLSVHWARHAEDLSLLISHIPCIATLDLIMRADEADEITHRLLQPLASMPILSSLSLSSNTHYRGVYLDLASVSAPGAFTSLRHLAATSVLLLDWSWPIRNLLSLELESLDVEWPKIRNVLSASPNLQRLKLVDLNIQNYPPPSDDSPVAIFPIFYHLQTIRMVDLRYSWYPVHTQPSILQAIRAPSIVSLIIHGEWNVQAALAALVLGGGASIENLSVGLTEEPILHNLITTLTDTPPRRLKTLMISHYYLSFDNPHHHDISDAGMLALGRCASLRSLKLFGVSFSEGALRAMITERMKDPASGLTDLQTTMHIGDVKGDLERLGVVVSDGVPWDAEAWNTWS
ncbi:hypothetical protein FRB95_001642 [Tulasnella sp. JGI-2019a]|nr:hypothetical protein FRB95_001642 [Tulasnella sp. JGI-2019a]